MKHWYQKPTKLLTEFVRTTLVMEGFSKADFNQQPIFTNGMSALLCRTERDTADLENITQLTLFTKSIPEDYWTVGNQTTIIAYFFNPFAMASLFNIPAKELSASPVDLCNWCPPVYNAIRTQLMYAGTTSRKVEVLDNLLVQQRNENQSVWEIVQYSTDHILNNSGSEVLVEVLEKLKLNERTFQRTFKKYVGVTPTQYRRICQFQLSFGQLHSKRFNKMSDVAFDNGFADQNHFIRSFKEFTDITPNDYLRKGLAGKNS